MEREKKKALIKSNIIQAAFKILQSVPYDFLSINTLCREADVSKRTFYSYFESKDDLYLELVYQSFLAFNDHIASNLKLEQLANATFTGIEQIGVIGTTYLRFNLTNPVMGKLITTFSEVDYQPVHTERVVRIREIANRYELSAYVATNQILPDILTPARTLSLWAQVHGLAQLLIHKADWLELYYKMTAEEIITSQMQEIQEYLGYLCKKVKMKNEKE